MGFLNDLGSTAAKVAGGTAGFFTGGPVGAVAGWNAGGTLYDKAGNLISGLSPSGPSAPSLQGDPLMAGGGDPSATLAKLRQQVADRLGVRPDEVPPDPADWPHVADVRGVDLSDLTQQGGAAAQAQGAQQFYGQGAPKLSLAGQDATSVEKNIFNAAAAGSSQANQTIAAPTTNYAAANTADARFQNTTGAQLELNNQATANPYAGQQQQLAGQATDQSGAVGQRAIADQLSGSPNAAPQLQLAQQAGFNPNEAPQLQLAQQSTASPFTVPQINLAQDVTAGDRVVGQQQQLADYLKGQAMGTNGPSAAQLQLQAGTDAAGRAAASMAASAGPRDYALARRAAIDAAASGTQQAGTQAAILRAQEQQAAQGQLGNVLQTQRGQSQQGTQIGAGINANLEQQRQSGIGQAAGITAGVEGQRQAGITNAAGITAGVEGQRVAAGTAAAGIQANIEQQRQAGIANAGNITQAAAGNYATGVGQAMQNTGNVAGNQLSATGQAIGVAQQDAALRLQQQTAQAQANLQNQQLNQGFYLGATGMGIGLSEADQQAYQNYLLQREGLSNQRTGIANNLAIANYGTGAQVAQNQYNNNMQLLGMGMQGAATLAPLFSDLNLKEDVRPAASGDLDAPFLELNPVHYRYRDPEIGGAGEVTGILAQDLERTPVGRSAVVETPIGKGIDLRRAMSLVLAQNASLTRRVRALEGAS